jgi:hypothetical protein
MVAFSITRTSLKSIRRTASVKFLSDDQITFANLTNLALPPDYPPSMPPMRPPDRTRMSRFARLYPSPCPTFTVPPTSRPFAYSIEVVQAWCHP